mmetsp:Transcript_27928/g.26968  ORF Transcript_27928/g.26968 Transcript_27928/m.26968 type:complete len:177 (+) Transcript_27928:853-1383(+)
MRSGQESRKKTRHREFLNEINNHYKEFGEFHKKKMGLVKRKIQFIKSNLGQKEKKLMAQSRREDQERIQALKSNDITTYINIVTTQKNERLLQILEQTHQYLEQLGAKVDLQKAENQPTKPLEEKKEVPVEGDPDADKIKQNLQSGSKVYYSITHTITEEIVTQPKLLCGGMLKSY